MGTEMNLEFNYFVTGGTLNHEEDIKHDSVRNGNIYCTTIDGNAK